MIHTFLDIIVNIKTDMDLTIKRFEHQIIEYKYKDETMYALSYPDDIIKQFYRMISYIVFIDEGKYTDELNFLKTEHKEYNALREGKVIELREPILKIILKVLGIPYICI